MKNLLLQESTVTCDSGEKNPSALPLDVTVVIAAYNRSKLITRALDSVRNQIRWPKEIIVVDDASTDNTAEVVSEWSDRHVFPVRVVKLTRNAGPAAARNRGIELARTAYVAFLDSDDEHVPTTLTRLVPLLDTYPDAVLSFADATVVTPSEVEQHALVARYIDLKRDAIPVQDGSVYQLSDAKSKLLNGSIIPTCTSCFRRVAALRAGGMPAAFRSGEDWLFWLRLSQEGLFMFQLDDLAYIHRHENNLTHPKYSEFIACQSVKACLQLLIGENDIVLTDRQREKTDQHLMKNIRSWRYHLSRLGIKAYIDGLEKLAADCPALITKLRLSSDPRSLLRAIYYSFRGTPK